MTGPDISSVVPLKWKPLVAVVSSILTLVVPYILQFSAHLPSPWPVVIGLVIAGLGALGVYHAPYVPKGHVVVPAETVNPSQPTLSRGGVLPAPLPGQYKNPWRS